MGRFKFDYSYQPDLIGSFDLNSCPAWRKQWLDKMILEQKLPEAAQQLRAEREYLVKKLEELDKLIECVESRVENRRSKNQATIVLHPTEFAAMGIVASVEKMIRRANCPLHVRDITEGLKAGGYLFNTKNPLGSVMSVLFQARKNNNGSLRFKGKNIYSLAEIEEKRWSSRKKHPAALPTPSREEPQHGTFSEEKN